MKDKRSIPELPDRAGTVRMAVALHIPGLLRDMGQDPQQIFDDLAFPVHLFADPETRVPVPLLGKLAHDCARITQCPHFGLLLGERNSAAALGKVGFIAKYSSDVGAALGALVANLPHNNDAAILGLHIQGRQTSISFLLRDPDFIGADHVVDASMALALGIMRELCGQEWRPTEMLFNRQPQADTRAYRRVFGAPIRFNADQNAMLFDSRWLSRPIAHADPALKALLSRDIQENGGTPPRTTADLVRGMIRARIGNGTCTVGDIGKALGLHPRTLTRRLGAEGTGFQQLLDETRESAARRLLRESTLPVGQIAALVDFNEPSAFTRAFQRWTGMSPAAWRRQTPP